MTLDEYLRGKNKLAFGRKIWPQSPRLIWRYLSKTDGAPPTRRPTRDLARRMIAASGGALTYEGLFGLPEKPAQQAA